VHINMLTNYGEESQLKLAIILTELDNGNSDNYQL